MQAAAAGPSKFAASKSTDSAPTAGVGIEGAVDGSSDPASVGTSLGTVTLLSMDIVKMLSGAASGTTPSTCGTPAAPGRGTNDRVLPSPAIEVMMTGFPPSRTCTGEVMA